MKKDKDLTVGRLALRADLINSEQLTLATEACLADKTISMGEALESRGFVDASGRAELERLAEREGIEEGEPSVSTLAAIFQRSRGPAEASPTGTVETIAIDLARAEKLDMGGTADPDSPTQGFEPSSPGHVRLSSLGDLGSGEHRNRYARTHIHARGGIGQVWLARDGDLGREVALKELRPEQGRNATAWNRFVEEARITGQLEHPGIVPVYELAVRPDDGKPFYTMRFIRGRTLNQAARDYHEKKAAGQDGPLDLASLLTAFVSLCNTAGYAHSRGVIHRDLKGQNVVLGDFGEVMLLDWGIAKLVDQPRSTEGAPSGAEGPVRLGDDESAHQATVDGQVLGSPFYMAPEQAEGKIEAIDARTDVYGLGAILYEILTGRPPYDGTDTIEVLRKVRETSPIPPRQVEPRTPGALEAICLKAMAKRPDDRYPTAMALADEVRRWLADEPVSTFREPWPTRLARWSKRHRTAVASAAALLMTAVVALSVSTVLIGRERDEARRQRQFARRAVDESYTRVAEQWLEDRLDPLQREFLEKALAYYREFAGAEANDPDARQEQGRAYLRMGDVLRKLGRHDEAESSYRRSIAILARLADEDPARLEHRERLAEATFRLGTERAARGESGEPDQAETLFRRAGAIQRALLDGAPANPRRVALGRTLANLAERLKVNGRADDSEATYRKAVALLDEAAAGGPAEVPPREELAAALDGLGRLIADRGKSVEARAAYERAVALFETLVAEAPNLPAPRDGLARAYNSLGLLLRQLGPGQEPESLIRKEIALNQRLAGDYPARPEYRRTLSRGLMNLGILCRESNRPKEAEELYRKALEINQKLVAEDGSVWKFRRDEARCLQNLAELLMASPKGESEGLFKKAIEVDDELARDYPKMPDHRLSAAGVRLNLAVWLNGRNRNGEATEAVRRAVGVLEGLASVDAEDLEVRRAFARSLNSLGNSLHFEGKHQEAEEAYRRAVNAYDQLVSRPDAGANDRLDLANSLSARGNNQVAGKLPGAGEALRRSVALMESLEAAGKPSAKLRTMFAAARNNLGDWLLSDGKLDEAEVAYRKAVDAFDALAVENAANPDYAIYLGQALGSLADLRIAQKRPDDAKALLKKGIEAERGVLASNPRRAQARSTLRSELETLATVCLETGDYAGASKAGDELLRNASDVLPRARAEVARLMARCVPMATADAKLTEARRAVMAGSYADRAIALLREAIEVGDPEALPLLRDRAFDPIRDRDGFKALEPEKIGRGGEGDRPVR